MMLLAVVGLHRQLLYHSWPHTSQILARLSSKRFGTISLGVTAPLQELKTAAPGQRHRSQENKVLVKIKAIGIILAHVRSQCVPEYVLHAR